VQHEGRHEDGGRSVRRPRLVVAVLVGALGVVVLRSPVDVLAVLVPQGTGSAEPEPGGIAIVTRDTEPRPDRSVGAEEAPAEPTGRWGAPTPRPTSGLLLEETRGAWRVESGVEEAAALAVVVAHEWADRNGIAGIAGSGRGAIVVVEAVEQPGAHHAVVTLLVASGVELHRIAIPFRLGPDGPSIAGAAWTLPAPALRMDPIAGTAIGDPELLDAARHALAGIGVDGERLRALEATDGWPFIARLDGDTDAHPWLRWHVDRFVVTGLPLDAVRDR
jgi:hypothetical protein